MLTYQILEDDNIVIIEPMGPLSEEDFRDLTVAVDAFLERKKTLKGILVHAEKFPGWEDFAGFVSHLRFVRDHHQKIAKIAVASDSLLADIAPKLAGHFVNAEVKGFGYGDKEAALDWLRTPLG
ncbi:MAG: STAS/SEC14 domain-containing protein [Luteolibacter sp.]|uniref:STAS/SEC14 domain-containing protein n=1 Tax=Luteolibacter sp. TaxID=1962973 RepID=UPI0032639EB6